MSIESEFPCEIIFKVVFRTGGCARESIEHILSEKGLVHEITERPSEKGTFISYTVTATYESETALHGICTAIKGIEGYMTMF
jgi:putative lipoic acid-binding regulatory protein